MDYRYEDSKGAVELSAAYLDVMQFPINVFNTNGTTVLGTLNNESDINTWKLFLRNKGLIKVEKPVNILKDHINPDHYKNYMVISFDEEFKLELQWMEAQQFKPFFRANPRAFVQAVLLQADKYLSRMGMKDDETQEILKALWYTKFAAAFMKNELHPIRIDNIPAILDEQYPNVDEVEQNYQAYRDQVNDLLAKLEEKAGRIAELEIDRENHEKELELLRRYAANTAVAYSLPEWTEGNFSKEEIDQLRAYR